MVPRIPRARRGLTILLTLCLLLAVAVNSALALPADGTITRGFSSGHNGVDIAAPIGTPIRNVEDGVVTIAGGNDPGGYGWYVQVRGESGYVHDFGHVNAFYVEAGQFIRAGDHIADVGNRGQSSGPHVHWRVASPGGGGIDPLNYEPPPAHDDHPEPPVQPVEPPVSFDQYVAQVMAAVWAEIHRHLPQPVR